MLNIVIFGPPGSGKGTQSEKIVKKYNMVHLSTGDILRSEIRQGTPLGVEAKKHIDLGHLVSDEIVVEMIRKKIEDNQDGQGFIFDGFPRTIRQAEELDKLLTYKKLELNLMLSLEVGKEELIKRLLERGKTSGRVDDQYSSVIENRIFVYHNKTAPLVNYYSAQSKFHPIQGLGSLEDIFGRIVQTLEYYLSK